jgi:hypothetical protein
MTACATLIPTKVNAASLSIRSIPRAIGGEIAAQPGDLIDIIFSLRLDSGSDYVIPRSLVTERDPNELSVFTDLQWLVSVDRPIDYDATRPQVDIARRRYRVENPVRDRRSDVFGTLTYDDFNLNLGELIPGLQAEASGPDVVPGESVPEPLTMLGAAAALGYGAILKRKYSKNTEF